MRTPIPGFAFAHTAGLAGSSSSVADHSKNASDGSPPAMPRSRTRPSWTEVSFPAVEVYQICGFGRADSVGSSAAIWSSPSSYASSRITVSAEKPRPDPAVLATNWSRCPDFSSIISEPFAVRIRFTCRSNCRLSLTSAAMRRNASEAVLNSCAECRISSSPNRNRPASSRASSSAPFPFCRLQISPTSKAVHLPAASPRPWSRTNACHGSSSSPAAAARSTASCPAEDRAGGTVQIRGRWSPSLAGGASSTELVNDVLFLRDLRVQLQPLPGRRGHPELGLGAGDERVEVDQVRDQRVQDRLAHRPLDEAGRADDLRGTVVLVGGLDPPDQAGQVGVQVDDPGGLGLPELPPPGAGRREQPRGRLRQ